MIKESRKLYFYHVYPGNYPYLIEQALQKRGIWKPFKIPDLKNEKSELIKDNLDMQNGIIKLSSKNIAF